MSFKRPRAAFESDRDGPPHHAPFALYGTPLPPFEENARDDGSYVPVWKQEVTDERGRKRLHGAFTGGFSAGYFNTVGSKEGWTPSTFVSSRSNRAKPQQDGAQQRPEDFMDEEDLAEQAESQKLETQGTFAGLGNTAGENGTKGMFSDLFRSTGETKGIKLLQRMGWRQGQGIGPKVRRRAAGDKTGETHLFAPDNSRMIRFVRKTDRKGLGFAGETSLEDTSRAAGEDEEDDDSDVDSRILSRKSKVATKPKSQNKSGFGVGVLNDDGSDDEDPYSMGPKINYSRIIGGDKKKKKGGLVASNASSNVVRPTFQQSKKLAQRSANVANFRKCHDGRLPLDGFVLATASLTISDNQYPPPDVPSDWKPAGQNAANTTKAIYQSNADAARASTLDPKARADLLGEQQLPGKSIFDFLTPAQRDKLAAASGKTNLPVALGEKAPEGYEQSEAEKRRTLWDLVPSLSKETAAAALARGRTGWMPYSEDLEKRERYKYYLELNAGLQSNLPQRPKGSSLEEWTEEMREFAEAAEIFKPVSGLMASRFTSGSDTPQLASDRPDATPKAQNKKEEDPAEKAAKMNLYGPLTRKTESFYPTRLLCKRFNVRPPPNVAAGSAGDDRTETVEESKRLDIVSQASINHMMMEANFQAAGMGRGDAGGEGGVVAAAMHMQREKAEVDVEKNEALEGKKAGEDVFKAIFGDDSDDE
ncbi:G patch domain-containing protein 1 [Pseudocercospora fuligena]|uniref:G patch domain-containing protein 1 n=1 Tax=Pseudocercospora fuligena TaxID=685502 RepID=A0A8H6VIM4_9PEZI|nr:G patch domain-containing protein 1 [Pseudocercospora fuligena]